MGAPASVRLLEGFSFLRGRALSSIAAESVYTVPFSSCFQYKSKYFSRFSSFSLLLNDYRAQVHAVWLRLRSLGLSLAFLFLQVMFCRPCTTLLLSRLSLFLLPRRPDNIARATVLVRPVVQRPLRKKETVIVAPERMGVTYTRISKRLVKRSNQASLFLYLAILGESSPYAVSMHSLAFALIQGAVMGSLCLYQLCRKESLEDFSYIAEMLHEIPFELSLLTFLTLRIAISSTTRSSILWKRPTCGRIRFKFFSLSCAALSMIRS